MRSKRGDKEYFSNQVDQKKGDSVPKSPNFNLLNFEVTSFGGNGGNTDSRKVSEQEQGTPLREVSFEQAISEMRSNQGTISGLISRANVMLSSILDAFTSETDQYRSTKGRLEKKRLESGKSDDEF
jgi:hypothetical protein